MRWVVHLTQAQAQATVRPDLTWVSFLESTRFCSTGHARALADTAQALALDDFRVRRLTGGSRSLALVDAEASLRPPTRSHVRPLQACRSRRCTRLLLARTREVGSSASRLAFTAAGVSRASCRGWVCPTAVAPSSGQRIDVARCCAGSSVAPGWGAAFRVVRQLGRQATLASTARPAAQRSSARC
jgi:hypothetical protein